MGVEEHIGQEDPHFLNFIGEVVEGCLPLRFGNGTDERAFDVILRYNSSGPLHQVGSYDLEVRRIQPDDTQQPVPVEELQSALGDYELTIEDVHSLLQKRLSPYNKKNIDDDS